MSCLLRSAAMSLNPLAPEFTPAAFRPVDQQQQQQPRPAQGDAGAPEDSNEEGEKGGAEWWKDLPGDDPITLEPLCELPCPPFQLAPDEAQEKKCFFDGKALANYLVASASFFHPCSRRPLTRAELVRLDDHLVRHGLRKACVTRVLDSRNQGAMSAIAQLRAEASQVLQAISGDRQHRLRRLERENVGAHVEAARVHWPFLVSPAASPPAWEDGVVVGEGEGEGEGNVRGAAVLGYAGGEGARDAVFPWPHELVVAVEAKDLGAFAKHVEGVVGKMAANPQQNKFTLLVGGGHAAHKRDIIAGVAGAHRVQVKAQGTQVHLTKPAASGAAASSGGWGAREVDPPLSFAAANYDHFVEALAAEPKCVVVAGVDHDGAQLDSTALGACVREFAAGLGADGVGDVLVWPVRHAPRVVVRAGTVGGRVALERALRADARFDVVRLAAVV